MFGKNEKVGPAYFKEVEPGKLFVTSMFMTLQGEGPFAGKPAFFIRLAKCNLTCHFCDTFFDDGDWMTFEEIEENIETTIESFYSEKNIDRPEYTRHGEGMRKRMVLVMTGGEPTLQPNLAPFLRIMNDKFQNTQIESNGLVYLKDIPELTTLVISPKCAEKNGVATKYLKVQDKVLERADCLKFVMNNDPDSPYSSIPEWANNYRGPIYISPMNIYNDIPRHSKELRNSGKNRIEMSDRSSKEEVVEFWEEGLLDMAANEANHKHAAKYCVEHGHIMNLQIHLYAGLA